MTDSTLSIWSLVLDANWIVQLVMLMLLLASVFSWALILQRGWFLRRMDRLSKKFVKCFWEAEDLAPLYRDMANVRRRLMNGPSQVFVEGFEAFSRMHQQGARPEDVMASTERMMQVAQQREQARLEQHLGVLATIGSVSPYVGLFGTVIGIMNAFRGLALTQQATLQSVAPGIAEALVATAVGLFAAIPAVVAYNRFNGRIDELMTRTELFAQEFAGVLHRRSCRQGD
jgi:biopolymer transport protein TolQ